MEKESLAAKLNLAHLAISPVLLSMFFTSILVIYVPPLLRFMLFWGSSSLAYKLLAVFYSCLQIDWHPI